MGLGGLTRHTKKEFEAFNRRWHQTHVSALRREGYVRDTDLTAGRSGSLLFYLLERTRERETERKRTRGRETERERETERGRKNRKKLGTRILKTDRKNK